LGLGSEAAQPNPPENLDSGFPSPAAALGFGEVDFGSEPSSEAGSPMAGAPAVADSAPAERATAAEATGELPDLLDLESKTAPPRSGDRLGFDPLASFRQPPSSDEIPSGSPPAASPAPIRQDESDLELLDFIGESTPSSEATPSRGSDGFQVRRRGGKVSGPFDSAAIVKMLAGGELLGNEEIAKDGSSWAPIGAEPAFAEAIQKLTESSDADQEPASEEPVKAEPEEESPEQVMARMKAIYGDRMANVTVVDGAAARSKLMKRLPFVAGAVALVLAIGVGVALGSTPYGYFGWRRLFPRTLSESSAAFVKFKEASRALREDTYEGYMRALADAQDLLTQDERAIEPRALFAQTVFYLKRRCFSADEKLPQAKRYLDELVLSAKDKPEVIKARAGYQLLTGDDAKIRAQLETIAASRRDDVEFSLLLSESFARERLLGPAAEALKAALAIDPKSAKALHGLGMLKMLEKVPDLKGAVELLAKALEADPRHLSSAVEIAAIQAQRLGAPEAAAIPLQSALSEEGKKLLSPYDLSRAHFLMGTVRAARHEPDAAAGEFEEALKLFPDSAPAKAAYGRFLLTRREYVRAYDLFDAAHKRDRKEIDYLDGLVRAMTGASRLHVAAQTLAEAAAEHPGNPRIAFLQARISDEIDKADEAERGYKRAIQGEPKFWESSYFLGRLLLRRKRLEEAKVAFSEALAKAPDVAEAHEGMGTYLLAAKKPEEAKPELLAALALDSELPRARFGMAQILVAEGALDEAKKEYEKVIAVDPSMPQVFTQYGALLWQLKELELAAAALEKAKNADPKDDEAVWRLGAVYHDQAKYPEALKNVDAALVVNPSSAEANFYKARIHYVRHENTQAVEAMKDALERNPSNAEYRFWMGNIHYQSQHVSNAYEQWQQAVKLKPDHADALEALGKALQEQQDLPTAISYFEKAMAADPNRKRLLISIAECLFNQNLYEKAITKYKEALKADPTLVSIYQRIGRCYNEKGQPSEAIKWYQKAVKDDPSASEAWRYLGYAYKDKGQKGHAIAAFEKYLQFNKNAGDAADINTEIYDLKSERN
jgi:tetratricopeptide (TPR) repeat protein